MRTNFKMRAFALMVLLMLAFGTSLKVNAWPLPRAYAGFTFDSASSGWLHCSGVGICGNVIGGVIFFDNMQGNWDYPVISEDEAQDSYYVKEVTEVE